MVLLVKKNIINSLTYEMKTKKNEKFSPKINKKKKIIKIKSRTKICNRKKTIELMSQRKTKISGAIFYLFIYTYFR